MNEQNKTCEERIDQELASRLYDLENLYLPDEDKIRLIDDGTLDTVLALGDDIEIRYSQDERAGYCDEETGEFDADCFISDHADELLEQAYEARNEYGLDVSAVENDETGEVYICYLLSYGGPGDEFRFYVSATGRCYRIEYRFVDWFDGASRDVTNNDVLQAIWEQFQETSVVDSCLEQLRGEA